MRGTHHLFIFFFKTVFVFVSLLKGYELAARLTEGSVKSKNDTIAEQTRRIISLEKQLETVGTAPPTPLPPDKKKPAVSRKPATSQRRAASFR